MHSFVVVVRKPHRQIPSHISALLRQADLPDLAFVPADHVHWVDAHQSVAFAGWQATGDVVSVGSHWHMTQHGMTAFSGRLWPKGGMWSEGESWASQLERHWRTHPVVEREQRFDGMYTAASLTATGTGVLVTDPLSIAMLYRSETDDVVVFSSSASLAARVAARYGEEPSRDPFAAAWLPFLGNIVGDRTGFEGTRVLQVGSYVEIDPAFGCRLRFADPTPWSSSELPREEEALVALVHEDLSSSVCSAAMLSAETLLADITGGRDSRLLLSLMLEAGVADRFTFRTTGEPHTPDAVVGRDIAERFQLQHEPILPTPMDESSFRRRLTTHVFQTGGMLSAWDFKGALGTASAPKISGMVGELLRTHYKGYPRYATVQELRERYHHHQKLDAVSILRPEVRSTLTETLFDEMLGQVDSGGSSPQDLLDTFYVRHRLRRWFGTMEELGEAGRFFPLYSLLGLQAAFAVGPATRWSEQLVFSVMRQASPELTAMPLAKSPWSEELLTALPDADAYRVPPATYAGPSPTAWQPRRLDDNIDVVRELLLDDRNAPANDILDRRAVERVLGIPIPRGQQQPQALFGALTAAVWLGHHETGFRIGAGWDQPLAVRPRGQAPTSSGPRPTPGSPTAAKARLMRVGRTARRGLGSLARWARQARRTHGSARATGQR